MSDSSSKAPPRRPKRPKIRKQSFVSGGTISASSKISTSINDAFDEDESKIANHSTVASHYNVRPDRGLRARNASPIIHMRNFNNFIKSVLIATHCNKDDYVLDLCCGKGGDLPKYNVKGVRGYVGADIAIESLKQAIDRYNNMKLKFPAKFIHADCCNTRLSVSGLSSSEVFDTVSCQFSLHYSFGSESNARTLLTNASERLKDGGKFLVTVPDAYVLVKKLRDNMLKHADKDPTTSTAARTIGNKVYRATFDKTDFPKESGPFGHRYVFHLQDAIDDCPEFLVPPRHFVNLCKEFQLQLIEELNFHEFYERYSNQQEFQQVLQRYRIRDGRMSEDEWDAIYLYRVYVFEKRSSMMDDASGMSSSSGASGSASRRTAEYRPQSTIQISFDFNPISHDEIVRLEPNV